MQLFVFAFFLSINLKLRKVCYVLFFLLVCSVSLLIQIVDIYYNYL